MSPWYWLLITPIVLLALDLTVGFIRYARAKQHERKASTEWTFDELFDYLSDGVDDAPKRPHYAILGVTEADASTFAPHIIGDVDVSLISIRNPNKARGMILDAIFETDAVRKHPRRAWAMSIITPALATGEAPGGEDDGRA